MLGVGTHSYQYDGLGNRIQRTVSSTVTDYLLDLQPGLARVLVADDGSETYRYVHSPRAPQTTAGFPAVSIHAQELDTGPSQTWSHMLTDGLGSVRGTLNDALAVNDQTDYTPFGEQQSSLGTDFAFTGELLDANGLQHHRARYYNPALGVWASLDPFEGMMDEPMSLNRYGYVSGNPINMIDPSGKLSVPYFVGQNSCLSQSILQQTSCPSARNYLPSPNYSVAYKDTTNVDLDGLELPVAALGLPAVLALRLAMQEAALAAGATGKPEASYNLLWWVNGYGVDMEYPAFRVNKMIWELPRWQRDILEQAGSKFGGVMQYAPTTSPPNHGNCTLRQAHSTNPNQDNQWRRVGKGGSAGGIVDVYSDSGIDLSFNLSNLFRLLAGSPPEGVTRAEFDWFIAMNAFDYGFSWSVMTDNANGVSEVCFRIDIADYYAWYVNPDTGVFDMLMAGQDSVGVGEPYDITGSSSPICFYVNAVAPNDIFTQASQEFSRVLDSVNIP